MIKITSSKKGNKLFDEISILSKIRATLLKDKIAKKICKEKDIGDWFLSGVPIKFEDIKQSAKTVNASIILNRRLMSEPFSVMMRYVIHELTHAIQHVQKNISKTTKKDNEEYLDKDTEIEAFKYQIEFDSEERGDEKAEKYVEDLLDYHKLRGKDREDKKDELLGEE
tara:strand:- start:59 stop:562 length:504 start_codon:yes stop_codon:yes gene_type:complete